MNETFYINENIFYNDYFYTLPKNNKIYYIYTIYKESKLKFIDSDLF